MVDELAAIIGVKAANAEWKLLQHAFQDRFQPRFGNVWRRSDDLPLRDFIDRIDMVDAFHSIQIPLMYGVDPQIAGSSFRFGSAALADGYRSGPRLSEDHPLLAVAPVLVQIVDMRHRDVRQPFVAGVGELEKLPIQNFLSRW